MLHLQQSGEDLISKGSCKALTHVCSWTDPWTLVKHLLRANRNLGQTLTQLIFPLAFTCLLRKQQGDLEARRKKNHLPVGVSLGGSAWEDVQSTVTAKVLDEEAWHPQWHCSAPSTPNCKLKLSSFLPKRNPEPVCPAGSLLLFPPRTPSFSSGCTDGGSCLLFGRGAQVWRQTIFAIISRAEDMLLTCHFSRGGGGRRRHPGPNNTSPPSPCLKKQTKPNQNTFYLVYTSL